ncbi:hypothetical protein [Solemya velesiana gill symbiont]|nr:hypothetical protein [Solemya velesiana gill symbiont]
MSKRTIRIPNFFPILTLAAALAVPAISAAEDNQELQTLVDDLKTLTDKARQQRAADRWLLNAMENLVAKYDWPWRDVLASDDFSDGDFRQDPAWQLIAGEFWVDGRLGLHSQSLSEPAQRDEQPQEETREEKQDLGRTLLGALLKEAIKERRQEREQAPAQELEPQQGGPAEIHLPMQIPRVFAAQVDLSVHNRPSEDGQIEFGLYQNQDGSSGYRLTIFTGQRPMLELLSIRSGRSMITDTVEIADLSDGQSHQLEWRRSPDGQIEILLDGEQLSRTRDNSFRYPFKRFAIANQAWDFAVQSVTLYGGQ